MILEKEEFLKNTIRNIVGINPFVSIRKMQELVEKDTGYPISKNYTAKLVRKTRQRVIVESDRKQMNERLSEVREKHRIFMEYLSRVLYWKVQYYRDFGIQEPTLKEKMMAMRLHADLERSLFKTEVTMGAFEKTSNQSQLPTEMKEQIVGVVRTWKIGSDQTEQKIKELE